MKNESTEQIDSVRKCFAAYETKDRAAMESLLAKDFVFSSPKDDRISREAYFERCWPFSEKVKTFELKTLAATGNAVFALYECHTSEGKPFCNTELFQFEGGKVKEVQVYFGWSLRE